MTERLQTFDFNQLSEQDLIATLAEYNIVLTPAEALTIQNDILQRPPTLAECILWSIQGSEHCSYKSSREHLRLLPTDAPNVLLGPKEDAGIVNIGTDDQGHHYGIIISHESHNHPSQIVPFEGAATGVGGNVRDVNCMGGEVIAIADSLRFGNINDPKTQWVQAGVTAGIASYGNALGIANLAGDIEYHPGYNDNCLVTVITLGIIRDDHILHSYAPQNAAGYDLILVGKPTDKSGFGGASFASLELTEEDKTQNRGAVQEPNAFLERHLLKANYALFKILHQKNLIHKVGFKDLGAGGIACASVELADAGGYGAEVNLDNVHVSMAHLNPSVILCAETQERFMWVVPPEITPLILKHYNETFALPDVSVGAKASVIGKIRTDGNYLVNYQQQTLVSAKANAITKGLIHHRPHQSPQNKYREPQLAPPQDHNAVLLALLSHENIASRKPIFETYDKQVQGRTWFEAGSADAGVMQPFNSDDYPPEIQHIGIALSTDHNPRYSQIDPYWGALNAVVESMRNVAAVGATPQAITDCLCFGNPEKPEQMGEFVAAVQGIADACNGVHLKQHREAPTPVIAGNVSLYNESAQGAIPASPMISCLGKLNDINNAVNADLKQTNTVLIMIGERLDECGGSIYYALADEIGNQCPKPDLNVVAKQIYALTDAIEQRLVLSAHDISTGGVAVALAEMSFNNGIGFSAEIPGELPTAKKLFSETGGFIIEVNKIHVNQVNEIFADYGLDAITIGHTNNQQMICINDVIKIPVAQAKLHWQNGLRQKMV